MHDCFAEANMAEEGYDEWQQGWQAAAAAQLGHAPGLWNGGAAVLTTAAAPGRGPAEEQLAASRMKSQGDGKLAPDAAPTGEPAPASESLSWQGAPKLASGAVIPAAKEEEAPGAAPPPHAGLLWGPEAGHTARPAAQAPAATAATADGADEEDYSRAQISALIAQAKAMSHMSLGQHPARLQLPKLIQELPGADGPSQPDNKPKQEAVTNTVTPSLRFITTAALAGQDALPEAGFHGGDAADVYHAAILEGLYGEDPLVAEEDVVAGAPDQERGKRDNPQEQESWALRNGSANSFAPAPAPAPDACAEALGIPKVGFLEHTLQVLIMHCHE